MHMPIKPMTVAQMRVAEGAKLLDKVRPGWAAKIDTTTLDMSNAHYCILGQAYRSYGLGREELFSAISRDLGETEAISYGFNIPLPEDGEVTYNELFEAWSQAIMARREGPAELEIITSPLEEEEPVLV